MQPALLLLFWTSTHIGSGGWSWTKTQNRRNIEQHYWLWFPSQTVNYDCFEAINSLTTSHGLFSYYSRSVQVLFTFTKRKKKNHYNILCNKRHVFTTNFIYAHWKTLSDGEREKNEPKTKCTPESIYNFMDAYVRNKSSLVLWVKFHGRTDIVTTHRVRRKQSWLHSQREVGCFDCWTTDKKCVESKVTNKTQSNLWWDPAKCDTVPARDRQQKREWRRKRERKKSHCKMYTNAIQMKAAPNNSC